LVVDVPTSHSRPRAAVSQLPATSWPPPDRQPLQGWRAVEPERFRRDFGLRASAACRGGTMRRRSAVLLACWAIAFAAVAVRTQAPQQGSSSIVIRGATLIDVRTGALQPNRVLVIEGNRIARVDAAGQVTSPAGATVIDAAGKFIMPGLWDTHAHTRDFDGDLNINHGVTSTFDMGNLMDWMSAVQDAREKQLWVGPRVFYQGMSIGGTLGPHQWAAKTVDEAVFGANTNIAAGSSFLKVYANATPDMIKAVADVAHAAGLNLTGHLGRSDAREAILAGIDAIAHASGIPRVTALTPELAARMRGEGDRNAGPNMSGPLEHAYQDPAKFDEIIRLMVERNVRLEPNLVGEFHGAYPQWDQYQLETHRLAMRPELAYMREGYELYVRMWDTDFTIRPYPPPAELLPVIEKALANQYEFVRRFSEAGGKLFTGTDNYYHVIAGLGVWHEMELLAEAGVEPLKILQAATLNPAEFVKKGKDLGTIEAGKLADLIILGRNPLENVRNIRSLESVIQNGKVQQLGYKNYRILIPRPFLPVNGTLPRPHISSIAPTGIPAGTKGLVLTIKGTQFNALNRVFWDDTPLAVTKFSPTQLEVAVPDDLLDRVGTWKIHMITGGRVHQPGDNYMEIMVTTGRRTEQRWNGQKLNTEF
jgi:imidazolonepropionase-like amidohydrolase